jgi:hypothetical protein
MSSSFGIACLALAEPFGAPTALRAGPIEELGKLPLVGVGEMLGYALKLSAEHGIAVAIK